MLATPGPLPDDPGWAFEFTWDGVRSLADMRPGELHLVGTTRELTTSYPEIDLIPALAARRVLLDGKLVALDGCGRPSLTQLQRRIHLRTPSASTLHRFPVTYYAFDVLRIDGRDTLHLPYQQRRELLAELDLSSGPGDGPVVLPPYFPDTDGRVVLDTAAEYGLPGVVAKRIDSPYQPGRRSRNWVQTTLRRSQEVVVGGWVPSRRGPEGTPGSLLLGVPSDAGLRYVGQVSAGLTQDVRRELGAQLVELSRASSPFAMPVPAITARHARWVVPELVGEVSYRRWTAHGRLGNPVWTGLRAPKHPAAVHAPVMLAGHPDAARSRADEDALAEALRTAAAEVTGQHLTISPHFLYNALSAIAALVKTEPARARELLMDFAGFTRYTLHPAQEFATLGDELENVERYLTLERARLDERLRVQLDIAPSVLAAEVPFLSVQAVVEEAVRNGIETLPAGGQLAISARPSDGDCLITVAADGPSGAAAALHDVDERLRLSFGDDYRLVSERAEDRATVSLRVPMGRH